MIPAAGQGCIAVDHRRGRCDLEAILRPLHHHISAQAVILERGVLARFDGGCSLPLGCYVTKEGCRWYGRAALGATNHSAESTTDNHELKTATYLGPQAGLIDSIVDQLSP